MTAVHPEASRQAVVEAALVLLALRLRDLDQDQRLVLLQEKDETVRWQPASPASSLAIGRRNPPRPVRDRGLWNRAPSRRDTRAETLLGGLLIREHGLAAAHAAAGVFRRPPWYPPVRRNHVPGCCVLADPASIRHCCPGMSPAGRRLG